MTSDVPGEVDVAASPRPWGAVRTTIVVMMKLWVTCGRRSRVQGLTEDPAKGLVVIDEQEPRAGKGFRDHPSIILAATPAREPAPR